MMTLQVCSKDRGGVALAVGAFCAAWLAFEPGLAHAYTISSLVTTGCHEKITADALHAVRKMGLATAAPLPANGNERALINDLEFLPDADMTDLGGATLLIGVRDNDLKGRDSNDLSQLALVHGDPNAQKEHCLRNAHEKEPGGSATAVADCHDFILERVGKALAGLDATGAPDPTNRTSLPLYLSLRHGVNASLPTYYVRIGQAIHAVEDSFTHTYRTTDGMKITAVLDWVDEANGNLVEATDGPPHATDLDRCDDADVLRGTRHGLATAAATEMLLATLDPSQTNAQKTTAVEAILDKYLSYSNSPACTFDNGWCNAQEHAYGNGPALGCDVGGPEHRASRWMAVTLIGLVALVGRRRRRRGKGAVVGLTIALTATLASSLAFAQAEPGGAGADAPAATAETHAPPPPVTTPVKEPGPKDPSQTAFGAYLGGSGSLNYEALAATLGARLRISRHWTFGLDAEWNPWIAVNGTTNLRAGAFNGYGTAIFRIPLAYEQFNLRITANLGVSYLLIDLYGAPKGSTGIYAGGSPLGLEWKMSRIFFLIINPLNIAVPTPQLSGVPFSYPQYRATIGLEVYGG
jgi:MYXO-CTERM domain-containing protein